MAEKDGLDLIDQKPDYSKTPLENMKDLAKQYESIQGKVPKWLSDRIKAYEKEK